MLEISSDPLPLPSSSDPLPPLSDPHSPLLILPLDSVRQKLGRGPQIKTTFLETDGRRKGMRGEGRGCEGRERDEMGGEGKG